MSNLLSHLKSITQPQHDQLEAVSFAKEIISQKISLSDYLQLLDKTAVIYQFFEPMVNQFITQYQDTRFTPFISHRLSDVEKDLANFTNYKKEDRLVIGSNQKVESLPDLIGVLYVLEGARLGGKVIVKALRKNPALADIGEFQFYQQTGIETRQRWLDFRALAEEGVVDEEGRKRATRAAQATFDLFYRVHRLNN